MTVSFYNRGGINQSPEIFFPFFSLVVKIIGAMLILTKQSVITVYRPTVTIYHPPYVIPALSSRSCPYINAIPTTVRKSDQSV